MRTYIFEGIMTALSSISHIGNTFGVNAKLRREKVIAPDNSVEEVPIISGNSLRGILRDRGMLHMLRTLGYGVNEEKGTVDGLSLEAFYFLFSGGILSKSGRGLDLDEAREWRREMPLVALFGGAMGNSMMKGKCKIDKATPICLETAHLLPDRFVNGDTPLLSVWDMCQEEAYTRKDDEKDENLRYLIDAGERKVLEDTQRSERGKRGTDLDVAEDTGQKQQMRYYVETLAAGSRLFWSITLDDVTDIEFEAFAVALAEFGRMPYIGGKSGVGLGKVAIKFDKWISVEPRTAPTGEEISTPLGQRYMQHLEKRAGNIRGLLDGIGE